MLGEKMEGQKATAWPVRMEPCLSTWGDDQMQGGTLGGFATGVVADLGTRPSDHHPTGINPHRDGGALRSRAPLRLSSDGDKPHRNEESPA